MNRKLLVTGGAGFIGSNFIRYLQTNAPQTVIINLDLLTYAGSLENLQDLPNPDHHHFIKGDVCDQALIESLLRDHEVDTIVHFAAESHVDRSLKGPGAFVQTNIVGTFSLLEAARKVWLQEKHLDNQQVRFHHISTDEVYGSLAPDDPAFEETTPYAPNSPYAASKASSDHLVRSYAHSFGLPITISNCSNNYGPYQFPEKLIPLMILNALTGKPLPIYGDGMQIRDWLYVEDHCDAIWRIIQQGKIGESYNIGGGNQPANIEIVKTICSILDEKDLPSGNKPHNQLIEYVTDRPGHDRRYAMSINKINKELGWQPKHDLKEGLQATVEWYLDNTAWLNAIIKEKEYQNWVQFNYQQRGNV
ncbi:dTDP-glucose 4,6-dehydratase [Patescibacteria group bacterium]|nr:dTDP-glucose 4,6-dehydratase [Patescibacteria group bacterium]